jgi:arsenite oxidase small subunit
MLCTHKGCPVSFRPERKLLICPCHWSSFDPAKEGEMVIGQGSQALPRILLRLEGDMVQAVGVDGLIYGREVNVL